jgi:hypothetical protein
MTESPTERPAAPLPVYAEPFRDVRDGAAGQNAQENSLEYASLTVIPWSDIWKSIELAKQRGNRPMINAFYEMLFREGLFDDRGAWSLKISNPK